jgi:hypothetical protein
LTWQNTRAAIARQAVSVRTFFRNNLDVSSMGLMRPILAAAGLALALQSCSRPQADAGAGPATSADPLAARKQELNRVIPCCRALQEQSAQRRGAFVRATQRCTASFADLEAGRLTAADVFKAVAEIVQAEDVPGACK